MCLKFTNFEEKNPNYNIHRIITEIIASIKYSNNRANSAKPLPNISKHNQT